MAEVFLSALLPVVMEKATNHILRQFGVMWGIPEKLEELQGTLLAIQSIIGNAEERQGEDHVRHWLEGLKEAAYQADGILDEFNVEAMRLKAGNQADIMTKVGNFFSFHNPVLFRLQIGRKLDDIIKKINKIMTQRHNFHFTATTQQPQNRTRSPTYSYVDESNVIGREEDKEKIVKLLLDDHGNSQNVAVLPIVGMGGLGKTTLAQLIYNDKMVEKHFQPLLIWVCVSDEFDIVKLAKAIILVATKEECNHSNMELLQHRLREVLSGKRYFLVLDDVWNEDRGQWDRLKTLLDTGGKGSRIIVTTRKGQVASIMGTLPSHYPQHLNENDSWELFKKRAFEEGAEEPQELISIGKDIVEKCDGLPLALNVLGGLMHSKSEVEEWLKVKNKIWDLPDGDQILSVLKLSYRDLPSHLKQCFAFCAIFPKDHVIEKEMLIQLWIANGFIPSDERIELEEKGNDIFNELAWRSFFQDIKEVEGDKYQRRDTLYHKTTCKMHDLMHDLAQSIMRDECLSSLEHDRWEQISKTTRHLYVPSDFQLDIQRTRNYNSNIRTLLMQRSSSIVVTANLLKSMPLRALKQNGADSTQLFNAIRFLKHLRYLDLSGTFINALPEATTTLFNLQTLKLSNSWELCKLPDGMKNMSNLRHLYINGCKSLKRLPTGMGQLRSLQTLTTYIVGNENGRRIDELNGLNLGGLLELYNLKNVRNATDAKKANLSSKHNLCSLILCWDVVHWDDLFYDSGKDPASVENVEEVLEGLRPHVGLKLLTIYRYGGASFSTWMKDSQLLQNLVEIHLEVCMGCEHLPPLWQSRSLKFLYLKKMNKVKYICSDYESNGMVQAFPSLKRLVLDNMQSLKAWLEDGAAEVTLVFPCLAELEISNCPNLMTMPGLPCLAELEISNCPNLMTMPGLPSLKRSKLRITDMQLGLVSSLVTLSILDISICKTSTGIAPPLLSQKKISFRYFKSLEELSIQAHGVDLASLLEVEGEDMGELSTSLHILNVSGCDGLFSSSQQSSSPLRFWKNLASLQSLKIFSCDDLVYWPNEEFRGLNSLESLNICDCKNLIGPSPLPSSFSSSKDKELLPNLKELWIGGCNGLLESLELPKLPASLKTLSVYGCVKLNSLTEGLRHVTALEEISISNCKSMTSLPVDLGHLTALQSLEIDDCPLLSSLPEGLQRLPSFRSLIIERCPNLERRCKRGGPYWEMVSQIPDFRVIISERNTSSTFLPSFHCFRRASTV